ncbi:THO complex subunit 4-like, partial [Trifolium medium]|nr:THO complex subunit 4-like [Trifolium medium]
ELFSELGDLKRYAVHYDKNGHPISRSSARSV